MKRREPEKESMSDYDFNKLLTRRMQEKGIPCGDLKCTISRQAAWGQGLSDEDRSLEGFLEMKKQKDLDRATGRFFDFDDYYR